MLEDSIRSDERRRIARDLHDSTSQLLVVAQLHLGHLRRSNVPGAALLIAECESTIREIRELIRGVVPD